MNCSANTMLKITAGLALTLGAAYFAFPEAQTFLLASAPYLLLLICPISMGIMMLMMKGSMPNGSNEKVCASAGASHTSPDPQGVVPGKI